MFHRVSLSIVVLSGHLYACTSDTEDRDCETPTRWYADIDGDGFGDLRDEGVEACDAPPRHVSTNSDCDDTDASVSPDATESVGNDLDEDCDEAWLCYVDGDDDEYGTDTTVTTTTQCSAADNGGALVSTDCDDDDPFVSPGDVEAAGNDIDEDCDEQWLCYVDEDEDGYGVATTVFVSSSCSEIDNGGSLFSTDCDDVHATVYPGAPELCDTLDNDCNDLSDARQDGISCDCEAPTLWYADIDGDGFGDLRDGGVEACEAPPRHVSARSDCDDADASVSPAATESVGNDVDEDCDEAWLCYEDEDEDEYGTDTTVTTTTRCSAADNGGALVSTDCDDDDPSVSPRDVEAGGNDIDEDCDEQWLCYVDEDDDEYGVATTVLVPSSCSTADNGGSLVSTDCDDQDPLVSPEGTETEGNDVDEDCDEQWLCYVDQDGDGYGTTSTALLTSVCSEDESGGSVHSTDCDDVHETAYPDAPEVCDGIDNDCNDLVDGLDGAACEIALEDLTPLHTLSLYNGGGISAYDGATFIAEFPGGSNYNGAIHRVSETDTLTEDWLTNTIATSQSSIDSDGHLLLTGSWWDGSEMNCVIEQYDLTQSNPTSETLYEDSHASSGCSYPRAAIRSWDDDTLWFANSSTSVGIRKVSSPSSSERVGDGFGNNGYLRVQSDDTLIVASGDRMGRIEDGTFVEHAQAPGNTWFTGIAVLSDDTVVVASDADVFSCFSDCLGEIRRYSADLSSSEVWVSTEGELYSGIPKGGFHSVAFDAATSELAFLDHDGALYRIPVLTP